MIRALRITHPPPCRRVPKPAIPSPIVIVIVITPENIHTFIISLPKDKHRREQLGGQLATLHIPYTVLEAVNGKTLSAAELALAYDPKKAVRLFNRELSKGEIGCMLSHVSIYQKMGAENLPHALVLEDDAKILEDDLAATLSKLAQLYPADTPVAVMLIHVKRVDANSRVPLDARHEVYDAYRGVHTHGYFITRAAAEILAQKLYPAYVVADKWEYFQENFIDVKCLVPYPVGLSEAAQSSSIEAMGVREKKLSDSPNYGYYLRKTLRQLEYLLRCRPFIRIEHKGRSELDPL
ncbi:MAG: glycosyltransferase family 25 protein [Oxalobacteraceae bacterium]|nr:MAG: glycosyltransferase family 25 protein [Oxalobacteraceae bacterium]